MQHPQSDDSTRRACVVRHREVTGLWLGSLRTSSDSCTNAGGWNLSHEVVRLFLRRADPGALILSALIR